MFTTVLVPASGAPSDAAVFATARLAAGAHGHIDFLHVRIDLADILTAVAAGGVGLGGGVAPQQDVDRLDRAEAEHESAARAAAVAFCAASGLPLDQPPAPGVGSAAFLIETGDPAQWLADHGRFADLTVVGRGEAAKDGVEAEAMETSLLDTGRPLLIAPHAAPATLTDVVAIGWTDTPQTARAVAAAIPLIDAAREVVILSVHVDEKRDPTVERLQRALRWHNPHVTVAHVPKGDGDPATLLLAEATRRGASVLVMGGFSHSPLREMLFGGATKTVMADAEIPVLMAH